MFAVLKGFIGFISTTYYIIVLPWEDGTQQGVSRKRINDKTNTAVQLFGMNNINVLFSAQHRENYRH